MKQPKATSKPTGTLYFHVYRLVSPAGVIAAIGSLADCERVQSRRPGTTIEAL